MRPLRYDLGDPFAHTNYSCQACTCNIMKNEHERKGRCCPFNASIPPSACPGCVATPSNPNTYATADESNAHTACVDAGLFLSCGN